MKKIVSLLLSPILILSILPLPSVAQTSFSDVVKKSKATKVAAQSAILAQSKKWTPDQKALAFSSMLFSATGSVFKTKGRRSPSVARRFAAKAVGALGSSISSDKVFSTVMLQLTSTVRTDPDPEVRSVALLALYAAYRNNPAREVSLVVRNPFTSRNVSQSASMSKMFRNLLTEVLVAPESVAITKKLDMLYTEVEVPETPYYLGMRKLAASLMMDMGASIMLSSALSDIIATHEGSGKYFTEEDSGFWTRPDAVDHYKMESYILDILGYMASKGDKEAGNELTKYAVLKYGSCSLNNGYIDSDYYQEYNLNTVAHARLVMAKYGMLKYEPYNKETGMSGSIGCLAPIINDESFPCETRNAAIKLYGEYVPDMLSQAGDTPREWQISADCSEEMIIFTLMTLAEMYVTDAIIGKVFNGAKHIVFKNAAKVIGPSTAATLEKGAELSYEAWELDESIKEYCNTFGHVREMMQGKAEKIK